MRPRKYVLTIILVAVAITIVVFIGTFIINDTDFDKNNKVNVAFVSNEEFINGLYSGWNFTDPTQLLTSDRQNDLNLTDSQQVFRFVFSQLDHEVFVYPTENYYYFIFPAQNKTIWGSISLFAHNRDSGVLGLGLTYIDEAEKTKNDHPITVHFYNYSATDGVLVKKIDDFRYSVTFEGKIVFFKLNDVELAQPKKAKLLDEEIFVGPTFDESGLRFFLIFNNSTKHLFWILDEDHSVLDNFIEHTDYLIIGNRTQFAFYYDKENNRKILVGVNAVNVLRNNWYDGPFDQMPDNYVYTGQIEMKRYLEANFPDAKIDKYGYLLETEEGRLAVTNYIIYYTEQQLVSVIQSCKESNLSRSEFYTCITQQAFLLQ